MVWLLKPITCTQRPRFQGLWCFGRHVLRTDQRWTLQVRLATMLRHWNVRCQLWMDRGHLCCRQADPSQCSPENRLLWVLQDNGKMFNGSLDIHPHQKVRTKLIPAKPGHSWPYPYPVPCVYLQTFKYELNHLIEIGALICTKESECASSTFIITKRMVAYAGSVIYAN